MAELAQEMLETDQRLEQYEDQTYSLNNLKDMPFQEFAVLHGLYPKGFMLNTDLKAFESKANQKLQMDGVDAQKKDAKQKAS